jgi:excisionase family DNA binding protein
MAMSEHPGIGSLKLFGRSAMTTDRPKAPTNFYTIEQIAECVGVCDRTVRRWIKKQRLVAHRFNGLVRISEADFQAFLAAYRDL